MIEPIVIKVVDKVPIVVSGPQYVVCDNSDYTVVWQLDEEWAQFESRTMQVNYKDGTYERVLFTGDTCALPAIPVKDWFYIGLFAGDIHTTRPAKLFANRAITTDSGEERDPTPDGYAQAIKALDGKLDKNQGADNAGKALVVGDDGNVVPGEAQGGGSLPAMSSDTAGKMLTNDGEKAEWGDVPKEVMVVNFTQGGGNWSADKNWDDAAALIESGGYVYAIVEGFAIPFVNYAAGKVIVFHAALHNSSAVIYNAVIWRQDGLISVLGDSLPIVMYGEQTLTADQQAQARKNIGAGTPYDLPIADADTLGGVKPVAKTDAMTRSIGVDTDGGLYTEPGAWYVTIMQTALGSPDATADKTPQEIVAAYQAGYSIYANIVVTPDANVTDAVIAPIVFGDLDSFTVVFSTVRSMRFLKDGAVAFYAMFVDGGWRVNRFELAKADDIPSALPNPNALTIKVGDNTTTYDGSAAKTVEVPKNGNPLGITSASVGQLIKVQEVDENGKPTKWKAVDDRLPAVGAVEGLVPMTQRIGEFDYAYGLREIDTTSLGIYAANPGQFIKIQSLRDDKEESGIPFEWATVDDNFTPMVVNITSDDSSTLSADKTFAEILAACQIGRPVKAKFETVALEMLLAEYTTTQIIFRAPQFSNNQLAQYAQIVITETEVTTSALSVPSSDNTLGITSATVGQIAKITAVDTEGKPTEWEAVDMAMGGTMQWYKCSDITTTEELTEYAVSQDENGVPIKDYNPVAIMLYCRTPADDTQVSNSGAPWIYPSSTTSRNAIRTIGNITNWKTTERVNNYIAFGSAAGIIAFGFSANNTAINSVIYPPYEMDGVAIQFNVSGDHFPVGTHFMVSVLGVKP